MGDWFSYHPTPFCLWDWAESKKAHVRPRRRDSREENKLLWRNVCKGFARVCAGLCKMPKIVIKSIDDFSDILRRPRLILQNFARTLRVFAKLRAGRASNIQKYTEIRSSESILPNFHFAHGKRYKIQVPSIDHSISATILRLPLRLSTAWLSRPLCSHAFIPPSLALSLRVRLRQFLHAINRPPLPPHTSSTSTSLCRVPPPPRGRRVPLSAAVSSRRTE